MAELNCKQIEKLIPSFIKNELDRQTEKRFLSHVEKCPSCHEELSIQFLVTEGMQRLENGDTFDLNKELRMKMTTQKKHLQFLDSLQRGLYVTEAVALFTALLILTLFIL